MVTTEPTATDIEMRADIPTDEGVLRVVARRTGDLWWVAARCGSWSGIGLHPKLGPAVDATLAPFGAGAAIDGDTHGD